MLSIICLLMVASAIAVDPPQCGIPVVTPIEDYRVVGGVEAKKHSWPWQISLRLRRVFLSDEHYCGGSLINDQWIVTAAHCVDGRESAYRWRIWLGAHHVEDEDMHTVEMSLEKVVKHYLYDSDTLTNDIALLKLSSPVTLDDNVNVVCLPSQSYALATGNGYVTGWGDTQANGEGTYPEYLQQVMTPIMDHDVCQDKMSNATGITVENSMLCAGFSDGNKGACSGDSGGPFVIKNDKGAWELAGIVSWGLKPCAQTGIPSIYTDTYSFLDWIQSNMS